MAGVELPDNVLQIINAAVSVAVEKAVEQVRAQQPPPSEPVNAAPRTNYFSIMEKLLYNYPALKRLVSDKATYTAVELREKSKSVVGFNFNSTRKSREDILEELERDKETEYDKTAKEFIRIERVVDLHRERKEFVVVRMYYFGETVEGKPRKPNAPKQTWEDISIETGRDEKTLRRWRSEIVKDMAICLFGIDAAIE